jgi:hypothetical protein
VRKFAHSGMAKFAESDVCELRRTPFSRTSENPQNANFVEFYKGEVRRIPIPRTTVNKGKKKGRSYDAPALGLMDSLLCYSVVSSTQPPPVVLPVVVP